MLFNLYYLLTAAETFLLCAYIVFAGSTEQASVLFNLSFPRLIIALITFIIGLGFILLPLRSLLNKSGRKTFEKKFLETEKWSWIAFGSGMLLVCLVTFLLTRQVNAYGDFKLIYLRLEPVLVWLAIVGAQTAFFSAIWYSVYFIGDQTGRDLRESQKELMALLGLFAAFSIFKLIFFTAPSNGPSAYGDEMTYFDMVDSLYRGFFSTKATHHYPPLYPLSLVGTLVFKGWSFDGIKLLNILFSSSIVFPIYFISRQYLNKKLSLIASLLSCLIPFHLVFPRRIVSENLFFPLFFWTMFSTLVHPRNDKLRLHWDIMNGILLALLYLTRYITLALIPFFLFSWWIKPFKGEKALLKPGKSKSIHFIVIVLVLVIVFSPWLFAGLREGVPARLMLGFGVTSRTTAEQLNLGNLLTWILLYACYFILISAPVLHLLIASLWHADPQKWRSGWERWFIQVVLIMAGFFAAVSRHSWRAYYNRDIPAVIMGRYLIVFSVIFFTIAMIAIKKMDISRFKSKPSFFLWTTILPFGMVIFAHLTLIKGIVIQTDGDLLKLLGSVDAYYIQLLGPYFFLLIISIYGVTNLFLWKVQKKYAVTALLISMAIYYTAGLPAYHLQLKEREVYPWLAEQITKLLPLPDPYSGNIEQITVYLPPGETAREMAEIYNSLRVRGIDNTITHLYSEEKVESMATEKGFIIEGFEGTINEPDTTLYEFNNQAFLIIPIVK